MYHHEHNVICCMVGQGDKMLDKKKEEKKVRKIIENLLPIKELKIKEVQDGKAH